VTPLPLPSQARAESSIDPKRETRVHRGTCLAFHADKQDPVTIHQQKFPSSLQKRILKNCQRLGFVNETELLLVF
jgi:hypothetical protein